MKKDRFRVVRGTSDRINNVLQLLSFKMLDQHATDRTNLEKLTFIDVKRREFWIVDQETLLQSMDFVKDRYNQKTIELKLELS